MTKNDEHKHSQHEGKSEDQELINDFALVVQVHENQSYKQRFKSSNCHPEEDIIGLASIGSCQLDVGHAHCDEGEDDQQQPDDEVLLDVLSNLLWRIRHSVLKYEL
jgi:hypothetical protein